MTISALPVDLQELKRKAEAATPGPWSLEEMQNSIRVRGECGHHVCEIRWNSHDGAYIAAVNPAAILSLIAEVESLRKQLEWISIKEERKPAHGQHVLARSINADDLPYEECAHYNGGTLFLGIGGRKIKATHWLAIQPLKEHK